MSAPGHRSTSRRQGARRIPRATRHRRIRSPAFVRIGSSNRRADHEMIAGLKRFGAGETFDEQPIPDLNSEAIDFRVASECFAPLRKLRRADLRSLRLTTTWQGREVPTVGGMLLFGRDRLQRFPDACVVVGRFAGTTRDRILDSRRLESVPVRAVEEAIAFVEKHFSREMVIGRLRRSEASSPRSEADRAIRGVDTS